MSKAADAVGRPRARVNMRPRVVTVFNQKGGVGKTTTAVNVAAHAAAAPHDRRVLLVDFDPQGHTTYHSGVDRNTNGDDEPSSAVHQMLTGKGPGASIEALAVETPFYDLLPGGLDVEDASVHLAVKQMNSATFNASGVFAKRVAEISPGRWDLIIVDCPPALGTVTMNSLHASHSAVIPLHYEFLSLLGIHDIEDTLVRARILNPALRVAAVVGIKPEKRTRHGRAMAEMAIEKYSDAVWSGEIHKCIVLAEAVANRRPINHYDPKCNGAKDYALLTQHLIDKGEF